MYEDFENRFESRQFIGELPQIEAQTTTRGGETQFELPLYFSLLVFICLFNYLLFCFYFYFILFYFSPLTLWLVMLCFSFDFATVLSGRMTLITKAVSFALLLQSLTGYSIHHHLDSSCKPRLSLSLVYLRDTLQRIKTSPLSITNPINPCHHDYFNHHLTTKQPSRHQFQSQPSSIHSNLPNPSISLKSPWLHHCICCNYNHHHGSHHNFQFHRCSHQSQSPTAVTQLQFNHHQSPATTIHN
jgi:hypothetical protein